MEKIWKTLIWQQCDAAIKTLELTIRKCPVELWDKSQMERPFWYIAFHTVFFLDYYSTGNETGYLPPAPFTLSELDPSGRMPERVYSADEILAFLQLARDRCEAAIRHLGDEDLRRPCGFTHPGVTATELFFYNMRHIQHHAAQLNLMLRQESVEPVKWISRSTPLEDMASSSAERKPAQFFDMNSDHALFRSLKRVYQEQRTQKVKNTEQVLFLLMGLNHLREWVAPGFSKDQKASTPEQAFYSDIWSRVPEFKIVQALCNHSKHQDSKHSGSEDLVLEAQFGASVSEYPSIAAVHSFSSGPPLGYRVNGRDLFDVLQVVITFYESCWYARSCE